MSQQSTPSSHYSTPSPPPPLLSILNVVVDHVMMEPCPLEPEEFDSINHDDVDGQIGTVKGSEACINDQAKELFPNEADSNAASFSEAFNISNSTANKSGSGKSPILVPVLRIFGPVLRNGDDSFYHRCTQDESPSTLDSNDSQSGSYSQQPQSGCLHIHGAFPYLLARPVVAGPDGSMHHGHYYSNSSQSSSQHVDNEFFSPRLSSDDVSKFSSDSKRSHIDWDNVDSVSQILEEVHHRLEGALRCSMEQPQNQTHPNQQPNSNSTYAKHSYIRSITIVKGRGFYTYCSGPPAPFLRVEYYDPSLRWRVKLLLERGIELSSWYHPDPGVYDYEFDKEEDTQFNGGYGRGAAAEDKPLKFRCYEAHIPYTMQVFKDYNLAGLKYVNVGDVRFRQPLPKSLRKRTKRDFFTEHESKDESVFFLRDNVGTELIWPENNTCQNAQSSHWLKKQTCCDLEFDTTVENILNVHDVMTELPSPLEERQKIHWRAVPSLKEIWEQERKRMKILLEPEQDFLSSEFDGDEDGSDDSGSSSSGSEDEMEVELPHQPQFTLNVKKNASVPGTRLAVKGVKQLFRTSEGLEDDFRRAMKDIVLRHEKFIDDVDQKIVGGANGVNGGLSSVNGTLSLEDGIEALAALGDQFTQNSVDGNEENQFTQNSADGSDGNEFALNGSLNLKDTVIGSRSLEGTPRSEQSNNHYSLTQEEVDDERKALESSIFEPHDDHVDNTDDFLCEEEELGEEEFERTLTMLASQGMGDGNHATIEYEEEPRMEGQNYHSNLCIDDDDAHVSDDEVDNDPWLEDDSNDEQMLDKKSSPENGNTKGGEESSFFVDTTTNASEKYVEEQISKSHSSEEAPVLPGELVLQPKKSLRCGDIESRTEAWHPLPTIALKQNPPWFKFQSSPSGSPSLIFQGTYLEPVKRAPSYNQVKSWMKRHNANSAQSINNPDLDSSQQFTQYSQISQTQDEKSDPLAGLGQQGCRVQVSGGGGLKTSIHTPSTFTPMTLMSIEVHVQCRIKTGIKGNREMAMVPDSTRDAVYAVVYVFARDPGGGENIEVIERGSVLVLIESKQPGTSNIPQHNVSKSVMGISSSISVEHVTSEKALLLRISSIVQMKDPDILLSWDTQGSGIGYLVERGVALGKLADGNEGTKPSTTDNSLDIARLLGRTPKGSCGKESIKKPEMNGELNLDGVDGRDENQTWTGSGLGSEWDDRVGAGAAAASIAGRIIICVWKICSEECKHPNASYQPAIVSTVLNKRIPFHDDLLLTRWYSMNNGLQRWRVIDYRLLQAISNIKLLDELDVLGRAGEAARLSGVEFSQSLPGIRGSQYKVEGVLLRALQSVRSNERGEKKGVNNTKASWQGTALTTTLSAYTESQSQSQSPWRRRRLDKHANEENGSASKDLGYFFYSPSKEDCSKQEALECQALTLEPLSGFQFDPVVVCDFTALYPSLVIAYNLCYSTVAGKLDYHSTRKEMRSSGRTTQKVGPFQYSERRTAAVIKHHMKSIYLSDSTPIRKKRDRAYSVPTGSLFVSESVLKGVLPQVLDEMLSTRAMLKKAAKEYKKQVPNLSPAILRQIEARQLALKYVANVTYGYTSATFSGRSAAPLVADAIVECGRRTLTNAINLANRWGKKEGGRWHGAQVLYGDTDSVFIKLPGRSVKEAFAFGEEYCKAVTASNPPPVQLKLEKVYTACLLQTKKKYCGMMCESASQKRPVFEAKGIETVRRDQCALTQKILRNALIKVFQRGIAPAKEYLRLQWALVHAGKLPVSDFVLTGRVRSRYRGGRIGPVQAALARRLGEIDPGRVVRHKERLPYVIVASPGKAFKLRDCVLTPLELLEQWDSFTIHSTYYITKHVNAALQRCFGLAPFNINIHSWYEACPKPRQKIHYWPLSRSGSSLMISSYFGSDVCIICEKKCKSIGGSRVAVCPNCNQDSAKVACIAIQRLNEAQQQASSIAAICSSCNGCLETADSFATEVLNPPSKKKHSSLTFGATQRRAGKLCNPMANCVCIDCPITYLRHELRELEIEASELMKAIF